LSDLYKEDFNNLLKAGVDVTATRADGKSYNFHTSVYFDFGAKVWFGGFYVPRSDFSYQLCQYLSEKYLEEMNRAKGSILVQMKDPGDSSATGSNEMIFSGRIYIYHEDRFDLKQMADLTELFKAKGVSLQLRGPDYVSSRMIDDRLRAKQN